MNTVDPKLIKQHIGKCYKAYDPDWRPGEPDDNAIRQIRAFKYHLEYEAGIKLTTRPRPGVPGMYDIELVEVVDELTFTMWMLKWA